MSDSDQVGGPMQAILLMSITGGITITFFLFLGGII